MRDTQRLLQLSQAGRKRSRGCYVQRRFFHPSTSPPNDYGEPDTQSSPSRHRESSGQSFGEAARLGTAMSSLLTQGRMGGIPWSDELIPFFIHMVAEKGLSCSI